MADRGACKRKAEKEDEFFQIRAKGQWLKVPKGEEYNDREVKGASGMIGTENFKKHGLVPKRRHGVLVLTYHFSARGSGVFQTEISLMA